MTSSVLDFFSAAYCELFLLINIILMFVIGLIGLHRSTRVLEFFAPFSICASMGVLMLLPHSNVHAFNGSFIGDYFAYISKVFILFLGFFIFLTLPYIKKTHFLKQFEYVLLILFAIFAMLIMVSAIDFIAAFIALEILSLSTYVLVALNHDHKNASKGAVKFFIYGSISTAFFLFGISFLYGVTASTHFDSIATDLHTAVAQKLDLSFAVIGLIFILIAFAFKLAFAPMHFWLPDIFQSVSLSVILFVSTLPKFAEYMLLLRILWQAVPDLSHYWQPILIVFGVISLIMGSLGALKENKIKPFFAYASTANIGFVLISLAQGTEVGVAASGFYLALYVFTLFIFIMLLLYLEYQGCTFDEMKDFSGLSKKRPMLSFMLVGCLLSFAGLPFFPGFFAKVYVLYAPIYVEAYALTLLSVLVSLIGIGYYLKLIKKIVVDSFENANFLLHIKENTVLKNSLFLAVLVFFSVLLMLNMWIYISHQAAVSVMH